MSPGLACGAGCGAAARTRARGALGRARAWPWLPMKAAAGVMSAVCVCRVPGVCNASGVLAALHAVAGGQACMRTRGTRVRNAGLAPFGSGVPAGERESEPAL